MKSKRPNPISGFTLLEVMVALAIMAVLALLTTQAIRSAISNRDLVSREISVDSRLADTLRIMRADIASAFHYRDIFCKMDNELSGAGPSPSPSPGTAAPGGPAPGFGQSPATAQAGATPKPCPPDVTGFIGNSDSLYFSSLSNVRTLRDVQQSDQAKIGYYVKNCRVASTVRAGEVSTRCLYRSLSPVLDEEIDEPGPETLLLEHVEEFKLRYLGPEHDDYVEAWRTNESGDDSTRGKFPYAVEITLTIQDKSNPKARAATQTVLAPIWFENNPTKKPGASPSPGDPGAGGQGAGP